MIVRQVRFGGYPNCCTSSGDRILANRGSVRQAVNYSIADIHLFRLYWRFANSLKPAAGALANLAIHHDRMMARPAVRRTIEIEAAIGYELPA
jgi:hypothetical protein